MSSMWKFKEVIIAIILFTTNNQKISSCASTQSNFEDKTVFCNNAVISSWTNANGLSCQDFYEDPSLCVTEENLYSINYGRTASNACCACGGGVWSNMTLVKEINYDYDYYSNHTNSNSSSTGSDNDIICIDRYGWQIEREELGNEPLTCDTFQSSDRNSEFSCYRYGAVNNLKVIDTAEEAVSKCCYN